MIKTDQSENKTGKTSSDNLTRVTAQGKDEIVAGFRRRTSQFSLSTQATTRTEEQQQGHNNREPFSQNEQSPDHQTGALSNLTAGRYE
jgi:hypothetical protein